MSDLPFGDGGPGLEGHRHFARSGRSAVLGELRRLQARRMDEGSRRAVERCELCGRTVPEGHRHLLDTVERRILCACETCLHRKSDDARYRPTGTRTLRLDGFRLSDELWARFSIPVGLAFFFVSSTAFSVVALYPSPLGATECELDMAAWGDLVRANPVLRDLEPDAEALLVNRMREGGEHYLVPIDRCYELVGLVKQSWQGISGGAEADEAIGAFFARLREEARDA